MVARLQGINMRDSDSIIRSLDPVGEMSYQHEDVEEMMHRITSSHTMTLRRARSRLAVASFAAAVCVAVVLVVGSTSPGTRTSPRGGDAPRLFLKPGQALSSGREKNSSSGDPIGGIFGPEIPVSYDLIPGPSLSSTAGSAPAYELSWPEDMTNSALMLAQVFGVDSTQPIPNGDVEGGVLVGSLHGQYVDVYPADQPGGILEWTSQYIDPPASSQPTPTAAQATADALALLGKIGTTENLSSPDISPYLNGFLAGDISIGLSFGISGVQTFLYDQFVFGPGGTLVMSMGYLADVSSAGDLPTISPVQAVVAAQQGTYYMAEREAPTTCGVSGMPPCSVTIDDATVGYRTFESPGSQTYLLPTWMLSGPSNNPNEPAFVAWISAIEPQLISEAVRR
jgi:hypothetical protein